MDRLAELIQILTDPENQPHQFTGKPEALGEELGKLLAQPMVEQLNGINEKLAQLTEAFINKKETQ